MTIIEEYKADSGVLAVLFRVNNTVLKLGEKTIAPYLPSCMEVLHMNEEPVEGVQFLDLHFSAENNLFIGIMEKVDGTRVAIRCFGFADQNKKQHTIC